MKLVSRGEGGDTSLRGTYSGIRVADSKSRRDAFRKHLEDWENSPTGGGRINEATERLRSLGESLGMELPEEVGPDATLEQRLKSLDPTIKQIQEIQRLLLPPVIIEMHPAPGANPTEQLEIKPPAPDPSTNGNLEARGNALEKPALKQSSPSTSGHFRSEEEHGP